MVAFRAVTGVGWTFDTVMVQVFEKTIKFENPEKLRRQLYQIGSVPLADSDSVMVSPAVIVNRRGGEVEGCGGI